MTAQPSNSKIDLLLEYLKGIEPFPVKRARLVNSDSLADQPDLDAFGDQPPPDPFNDQPPPDPFTDQPPPDPFTDQPPLDR